MFLFNRDFYLVGLEGFEDIRCFIEGCLVKVESFG